jgi:hypothetical protein
MPMIDVYATAGTFPDTPQLAANLARLGLSGRLVCGRSRCDETREAG